jgi:hypothetical protein
VISHVFCSFTKVVTTTKREASAVWGAVNPLFESKTLAGGEQEMDLPEERIDTERGFEYRKIFALFKVSPITLALLIILLPVESSRPSHRVFHPRSG